MATYPFEVILQELGAALQIHDLHPDRNNSCLIRLPNQLEIQIEMDSRNEKMIVGCDIGVVPVGRYRTDIFKEALKANGLPMPRYGIFATSVPANKLALFEKLPMKDLNGQRLAEFIVPFAEKALLWKEALARDEVPVVSSGRSARIGMFGLRP